MIRHLHPELLADIALGETAATSRRDRAHLLLCRRCAADLAELRRIVSTGREAPPEDIRPPRSSVLARIQAEVAADDGSAGLDPIAPSVAPVDLRHPVALTLPRRRPLVAAIAAAAAVAVVVAGAVWQHQASRNVVVAQATRDVVVAQATLNPLPSKSGRGTAKVVRKDGVEQLSIAVDTLVTGPGFEELWLINTDGRRMISLGVVPPNGRASYPMPAILAPAMGGYVIVDISLEPFDGNTRHSGDSVLRGTLD